MDTNETNNGSTARKKRSAIRPRNEVVDSGRGLVLGGKASMHGQGRTSRGMSLIQLVLIHSIDGLFRLALLPADCVFQLDRVPNDSQHH
eukprot:3211679-Prymnesium_polylepis.1